jgi:diguanylate cyclase (GGDEF)-like protein/putative nucleotidyltransferase with HDIG domain
MGDILHFTATGLALLAAILILACYLAQRLIRNTIQARQKEADFLRYSNLHLLTSSLVEGTDPGRMAEETLDRLLQAIGSQHGCMLLEMRGWDELTRTCTRGFSAAAVGQIAKGDLRAYLLTAAERWGVLMVFPNFRRPPARTPWQADARFRAFLEAFSAEPVHSLAVVGLQVKERSFGAMVIGSAERRVFQPGELRLTLAIGNQISVALENWYLHKMAERHNEDLRTLHRIVQALAATFDLDKQVQTLHEELQRVLGARGIFLSFQEAVEEGQGTDWSPGTTPRGDSPGCAESAGPVGYILATRKPCLIAKDFVRECQRLGIPFCDPRIRTWCGVPIPFSDGSAGVLAVADYEREEAIDARQFELLQVLASEAAVAIENARLFQRERRRLRHLVLLNDLGRQAAAVLDPKELLNSICLQIRSGFGYEFVRIETRDRERDELIVGAQEGYGGAILGRRGKFGEGLSGSAARAATPAVVNSFALDSRHAPLHPAARSALSLPLNYRGEVLGVLSLESLREKAFSQQDVLTLQTLGDQLAVALHNARAYQVAVEQAITDGLTGLKTHRFFMEALEAEWRRATRSGRTFSVIMMDLDGFKQVNDLKGHMEGDRVLTAVASLLEARSRQSNVVARYGGDEFVVLLPEASTEQAEILAERLRSSIASDSYLSSRGITGSFGIATFPVHAPTPEEILRVADSGMYLAKHKHGNSVRVAALQKGEQRFDWEQQLLEAYLGVAVKRMFSTGPEAFEQYLHRFEQANQLADHESLPLLDTVTALAFAIDAKDHYTQGHSQSVARWAALLAEEIGLTEMETEEIRLAGILHDVGKIGIPENLLNKPSRLTGDEFDIVKQHAELGQKILEPLKVKAIERIRQMVRHHHEHFNGQGYPDGLAGEMIPLGARILTIADCFDSMVTDRAYRKGRSAEDALQELLRCRGTQFDPRLVEAFIRAYKNKGDRRRTAILEGRSN